MYFLNALKLAVLSYGPFLSDSLRFFYIAAEQHKMTPTFFKLISVVSF